MRIENNVTKIVQREREREIPKQQNDDKSSDR